MDETLKYLFNIFKKKGFFETEEEFLSLIENEGVGVLYPVMPEGMFETEEEFLEVFGPSLKKKDDSQLTSPEEQLEYDTPGVEDPGSSDISQEEVDAALEGDLETIIGQVPDEFGGGDVTQFEAGRRRRGQQSAIDKSDRDIAAKNRKRRDEGLPPIMTGEKDTWLERTVGKTEVTDFFGDLWRAGAKGFETGNTIDEALEVSLKGTAASDQDIQDFIQVTKALEGTAPSDEMKAFNKAFSAAGGGAWGFIKGIAAAPTSINEIAITSIAQMINPAVLGAAAAGGGVGAATGAALTSWSGPGALFGAAAGGIGGAMGAAGATLEAGLSFSEFLQEELAEKGLAFDLEGVRKVLADEDALFRIRAKSAGRGAIIGVVDAFTAGIAGKVTKGIGTTVEGAIKAGKTARRANVEKLAVGAAIESLGGGVGEAGARAAVGQEMDAAEIGFEMVGNMPGSAISVARNLVINPTYKMGPDGTVITREEMLKMVQEMDDVTFAGAKLNIKGDLVLKELAEARKDKLRQKKAKMEQLGEDLDNLSVEDAEAAIELETELDKVRGGLTRAKKNRKKEIETQLDEIYSRRQEPTVEVEVTEAEVFNEIKRRQEEDGRSGDITTAEEIESVRQELLKEKQDAIQESSTTEVDVQEQAADGETVGERDAPGGIAVEGEEQTEVSSEATQEEIEQGAGDLESLLNSLSDSPANLGDATSGRNRSTDREEIEAQQDIVDELNEDSMEAQAVWESTADPRDIINNQKKGIVDPDTAKINEELAKAEEKLKELKGRQNVREVTVNENLTVVDQTETDSHYGSEDFKRDNPDVTPQQHEEMLMGRVDKALKAVKKLFPKLKIVMHRSEASYREHVSTNSRGAFNPNTNTIHINMPKATGRTIGHEVFHAILKDRFGSEVNIQVATQALIKSLRAGINKSTNLTAEQVLQLEKYAQIFEGDQAIVQDEEFLAEFVGFLSETYSKLEVPQQTAIKQWLAKIAKILGFSPQEVLAQSDRDVVDLLNTIAEKVTEGQEITETDVAILQKEEGTTRTFNDEIEAARNGDVKVQEKLKQYGIEWEYTPTYRFVGQSEVDALNKGETIEGKNKEIGVDVTTAAEGEGAGATTTEYRVTFKQESFDNKKEGSRVRMKNKQDGWVKEGYSKKDVAKVEKRKADGTWETVVLQDQIQSGKKVDNPSNALKTQKIGAFEVSYTQQEKVAQMIKDGLITEPKDVSFLSGQSTAITSPDDMLVGEISLNGKPIFEGGGGVFFVTKYGDVWAAGGKSEATKLVNAINRGLKENGGKGYLTLTKGTDKKLVSSASGVNSTLAILDSMLDEGLVSPSNFRAAVSSAVKRAGGEIDLRGSSKKLKADVNKYFSDPSTTTFEKRGNIVESIVGEIAKSLPKELRPKVVQFLGGDPNKSVGATKTPKSQSLVDLVAGVAAEKLTKGLSVGDIYAVIEVDGEVEMVKDSHPSYPFHISLKDKSKNPILHLPKNREAGSKALVHKSGKPYAVRNISVLEGKFQGQTESVKTQAYSDDLMYQYGYKYSDKNGEVDVDLVLEKIDEDIASLKNKDLLEKKLTAFEELIIPAISEDITSPALTQFEADVLMDPNATAESIERGFRKAKNIIDKEGSIDFSKTKESDLFKGGEINLPAFERFVKKNPEYQGVFNDWEKLFNEHTESLLKDLNAFNVVDIELAESFKKQLQQTDIKTQAIGQNAELSAQVREDLQYAKVEYEAYKMQEDGTLDVPKRNVMTPAAIKEITGWELGADGKWKYEIQDGRLKEVKNGTHKLGDIYDAPEFYDAYPEAKDISVAIAVRPEGRENSWFMPEDNSIEINVKDQYRVIQDLVHELQHFVQFKEGFAIGGNADTFYQNPEIVEKLEKEAGKEGLIIKNEMLRALSFTIEEAIDEHEGVALDKIMTKEFLEKNMGFYLDTFDNLVERGLIDEDADFAQALEDFYVELPEMDRRKLKIAQREGGMYEALDAAGEISVPVKEALHKLGNHAMYERLMGEVEARNVSARLFYTAEQRARKTLESTEDVAREEQIAFFDSDIKTQAIVENTTEEVNRLKGLEKKSEDGATLNIDGTQYTGGGLVVPAATKNTTQSELTPQMIEKFVEDNDGKIGEEGIVKVGLYKFPKSDQVSIDLNIVVPGENREAALEFGRLAGQESLFDLDTFENVKTGATGANPISFTDAQFRQIAKDLKANKVPKVFEGDIKTQKIVSTNDRLRVLGRQYNMNPQGFTPSYINLAAFQNAARKLGFGVKKARGPQGGYYFTRNGSKVNVMQDMTKTQVFKETMTVEDIIKFGRENNFTDAMIKDYLVRVKKEKVKEVNKMMAIDADMFRQMPVSFGNIEGGARVGVKLFARVEKFMQKLNARNNKRKEENKISEREIMDQTIEFLEKQPEYIAESGKRKQETDQQTQMIIELQKALGVNPTKGMNTRIREMRQKMVERRRGGMDLQAVKRDLRNFIRQALPTIKGSTYSKSELMKLLGKVAKADKKNISNLMNEVVDLVTERQVKALDAKIESILNGKYEVVQSGRLKGVKIDVDTRQRLEAIQAAVTDEAVTADDIVKANLELNEEFTKLTEKTDQTEQDLNRMADLMVLMSINNSKLMDDTNIDKVEALSTAEDILLQIVGEGRETFKEQLRADHERYKDQFAKVYKDVTGETIDLSDPEVMEESQKAGRKQARVKKARDAEKGLIKYLRKLNQKIKSFFKSSESIEGLMEIIAEAPGVIFGGNARKLVYEGLNAGIRVYKARMMEASAVIKSKVKEVYGKNWKKISRENSVRTKTGVYVDPAAVQKAQEKYDTNKTFGNKKALEKVKKEEMVSLSPNEIGFLWQQYQDPANLPSFANEDNINFGPDHARIMAELVETIGGEDGKVIELAKWQVEEFYPSMYPHLNEAYKKIYRTNMPWNKHYAGRLKREGRETLPLDMLASNEAFNNQVGAASTKVRIKNSLPIEPVDMMGALVTYATDMEWFAAMGPTVRDINKLFGNPMMRKAIINVAGEATMRLIDHHIKNIAARGINTEQGQDFVNAMNNFFATTRLGFSPNIALKQLTSIPTYASDIGWGNYMFHAVKNKTEFLKVFKEIWKNSVYLQDRMSSDIRKVTESYSGKQDVEFVPQSTSSYFVNMMMAFIKAGDITAIFLGGMPNYSFYKAEFMKANPNATEQQAIDHAIIKFEADTKSTQQSMELTDKDFYQSSGAFARALNLFKTAQRQYLRKEFSGIRNMRRGLRDKNAKQFAGGANKFLMYHLMMPMLFQYIASGLPGLLTGWDDEDTEDMIRAAVLGNFNALFAVGDIIKGVADAAQGKPWADKVGSIPVFEVFADINKNYMKWQRTKDPEKKQEAFEKMMARIGELATLGKIPFANLNRMYKNIEKASEASDSKEVVLRLLNFSDYVIEGGESDTKSTPKTREERDAEKQNIVDKKKLEEEKKKKERDARNNRD